MWVRSWAYPVKTPGRYGPRCDSEHRVRTHIFWRFTNGRGGPVTNLLDRWKARLAGTVGAAAPRLAEKIRDLVTTNRWDQQVWTEARKTSPVDGLVSDIYRGDEHRGGQRKPFDAAEELCTGLFFQLYKAAARLTDTRDLERDLYPAAKILAEIAEHPGLQELQAKTANDPVLSTIGLKAMGEELLEILGRIPPPPPPGAAGGQGDTAGDQQDGDQPSQDPGDAEDKAEADWQQMYDELLKEFELDRAVDRAVQAAAEETDDLEDTRKGIGLEDGEWRAMSPEERLRMADQLRSDTMRQLAKMIGRMKRFALGVKATRIIDVPQVVYNVELGREVPRLLLSEFALLGTDETRLEFYRRWNDGETLQFAMHGIDKVGRGPIVVAIDKSSSMNAGGKGVTPFTWAMGVAEALRRLAADEDRDYHAIFFGNNNDRHRFHFPKGKGPFEKVLAFLSVVADGGTQFEGVLTEALQGAGGAFDAEGKGKADICFITDGAAHLSDEWIAGFNAERERIGVRVVSVFVGGARDMDRKSTPLALLHKISDVVVPVTDLVPQAAEKIFARV